MTKRARSRSRSPSSKRKCSISGESPKENHIRNSGPKRLFSASSGKNLASAIDFDDEHKSESTSNKMVEDEDEVDPLDAFMVGVNAEVAELNKQDAQRLELLHGKGRSGRANGRVNEDEENEEETSDPEDILALASKKVKKKDLAIVDHSQIKYEPFRKDFYIEHPELQEMTPDQVDLLRIELDGIKIRGVDCPKPIKKWTHAGMPAGCLEVIRKLNFVKPTPIQAQAIPAIMNGRDVIGVAKTGSGKTIAFLLPMFRHIMDQRFLEPGEGPIAVIMTPTRELAVQIHKECKLFLKILGLRAVCAYGGSPIKDQIAELKRGAEIVVCTPGRMIDLLCANSGRVTNLRRCTYLVLDEADRMFDMGFEPQVMRIVNNVRPDRQTVLFSATFPRQMEALARKILRRPLEITVGGRSVVSDDVQQVVEVIEDDKKFLRLLEILGETYHKHPDELTLIFVDRQEAADNLLGDLMRRGYFCMSIHGGKDQADRDSTIRDFKNSIFNILIATSVAARGLDVKKLGLVINYECPNHMEDYVHRCGRTGRAGNKGIAYTFITPEQDRYAMDILKALRMSKQPIPEELQNLVNGFQEKIKAGSARAAGSGFGGKGLEKLEKERDTLKKLQRRTHGGDVSDQESDEETGELEGDEVVPFEAKLVKKTEPVLPAVKVDTKDPSARQALKAAQEAAARISALVADKSKQGQAKDILSEINSRFAAGATQAAGKLGEKAEGEGKSFCYEVEINDYPQKARWRINNKETISQITEDTGAAITTRGTYFPPGKQPGPGERKLYLVIEGDTEMMVELAKNEVRRILTEATIAAMEQEARQGAGSAVGRYSVV
ncbi:uncharacterized protein VTP21DRAFT_1486 [Calcarisporiella thermophila]|uniref:uncharacterized protein n=1 Tax=Calcarisporiella thermophila TaxID=911321 RepID=UPI0037438758